MELARKFQETSSCTDMSVAKLQADRPYPITFVERIGTWYGPDILMSLRDSPTRIVKLYLPRRYYSSVSDADIADINSAIVSLGLVYQGQCVETKSYKVAIEKM
jgi:hypothetical protein